MDSSNGQHNHQEMSSQTLESMLVCTKSQQEKKPRPADMQALKCPRCDSTNTKFCYYNNYSLSQPRYFCKSCRRYWTKGGTLRNVPVGGGCRKNRRSSSSSSKRPGQDQAIPSPIPSLSANNHLPYDSNDLSLAIARLQKQGNCGQLGMIMDDHHDFSVWANANMAHHHGLSSSSFGGGFLDNSAGPSGCGLGNLYYGSLEMESGGMGMSGAQQEMGIPFEDFSVGTTTASTAVTTVKQEVRNGGESRVLWGFPWQGMGGGGDGNVADLDSSSRSMGWNGIGSANWHGLLNSPLM